MNAQGDVATIFGSLEEEARRTQTPNLYCRRASSDSVAALYLAVQAPEGRRGIMLGIRQDQTAIGAATLGGAGYALKITPLNASVTGQPLLALFCTNQSFDDIFDLFVQDLVAHVLPARTEDEALSTFLARVQLWERFFGDASQATLSSEAQAALYAELVVMRDLLIPTIGTASSVRAWKGPDRAPQDFVVGSVALEVKSSRGKAPERAFISSELQLDDRPFSHLVLVYVPLSSGGEGCPNLNEVIEEIEGLLRPDPIASEQFRDKLITARWLKAHAEHYKTSRFLVRTLRFYEVKTGFPRITAAELPAGVGDLRYSVVLGAASTFLIDVEVVKSWLPR
jgi:hypothetical protein